VRREGYAAVEWVVPRDIAGDQVVVGGPGVVAEQNSSGIAFYLGSKDTNA
jgi:hypothetical protein